MLSIYIFSGLLVGFLVGLTGVGGGSLMTPLLVFLFGVSPATAVGTDLLFAAITKSGGVWVHHFSHRSVDWKITALLASGSLPAAFLLLLFLEHSSRGPMLAALITPVLGVALILTALALFFRRWLLRARAGTPGETRKSPLFTVATGAVLGVLVTMTSVGAGALGTIALIFLYPGLPTLRIVGTDLAHAILLSTVAGLGHLQLGHVDFALLASLLAGSLPGIFLGSLLSGKIPDHVLKPLLASLLLAVGLKFLL